MGRRNLLIILGAILVTAATFSGGYLLGHQNLRFADGKPTIVNLDLGKPKDVDFSLFWDTWRLLEEKYIGTLDPKALLLGAIRGMVAAVGDPYTVFLPPDESEAFLEDLAGRFEGIGAEIAIREERLIIVAPLTGSPAAAAGLKPRDWIIAIDGEPTETMTLAQATQKIRGKAGTSVTLTILSQDSRQPRELTITRATITVESVQVSYRPDGKGAEVAVVRLIQFGSDTPEMMRRVADAMLNRRVSGIVLDLRNNPGGFLDAAIDVTSLFVKEEVIVRERKKDGSEIQERRTGSARLADIPLVVLINGGSASASEILAGAIQDYRRGPVIGETSFGKGSVQDLERLSGGSSLRVTVAKWFTPNGREIDEAGIAPDIVVERTDADVAADRDPQLDRAVEELSR